NEYEDDYRTALLKLIQEKVEHGGKTPAGAPSQPTRPANVIDLASVLRESLDRVGHDGAKRKAKPAKTKRRPKLKKAA
ncbi:MAG: Ku protein, partial [Verrucomicrobiales bacterium]|nr:Ku protein [Verrucomicrobiales bacterium]